MWGGADRHSLEQPSGRSILAVMGPPGFCLSWGERLILHCVPQHPGLLGLHPYNLAPGPHSPLCTKPQLEPPLKLLLGPEGQVLQPFRELGPSMWRALPGAQVLCYCPREPEGIPAPPELLLELPVRAFLSGKMVKLCFSRTELSCP